MVAIRTKPAGKQYRDNYDGKRAGIVQLEERLSCKQDVEGSTPSIGSIDETIDWGEFQTHICVNNDPHFGG